MAARWSTSLVPSAGAKGIFGGTTGTRHGARLCITAHLRPPNTFNRVPTQTTSRFCSHKVKPLTTHTLPFRQNKHQPTSATKSPPANPTANPSKMPDYYNFEDTDPIERLIQRNTDWADRMHADRPEFFHRLANQQKPQILWFGCSDSRVPETSLLDLMPGEVFVHRNIANVLPYNDLNSLCVLQYAVEVLKVKHIIVCGHYGCGGIAAALGNQKLGIIDLWLKNIRETRSRCAAELDSLPNEAAKCKRLVELNAIAQVRSLLRNTNVIEAIKERGLQVHALVYDVADGYVKKLEVDQLDEEEKIYTLV